MRLGLIARADNSGLGVQTWELYRHLQPDRVLVVDVSQYHNNTTHSNKRTFVERYANPFIYRGWVPDTDTLRRFMTGLDVVFSAECFYSPQVPVIARELGVKTVLAPNFEFLDPKAQPDLWAAPTLWRFDEIPTPKVHLPVPIATDRFKAPDECDKTAGGTRHFLHIVGRPAVHDRNGTEDLLRALQYVTAEITVILKCQNAEYLPPLLKQHHIPPNVTVQVDGRDVEHYWDNYEGDVLLSPRRFGGLHLPALEALGAGMPVVMTDVSPNNTWLPTDWLVPATPAGGFKAKQHVDLYSADHRALGALIDRFSSDAGFYTKARSVAAELRDQYSWKTLLPKYIKTFEEL